jgi:hypothetical protein
MVRPYRRTSVAALAVLLMVPDPSRAADQAPADQEKVRLKIEKPRRAYEPRPGVYCGPREIIVRLERPSAKPSALTVPEGTRMLSRMTRESNARQEDCPWLTNGGGG